MPALTNQRRELFAQFVARGIPPYRAYPLAGYKFDEGAPYRLSGNVRVKARLAELRRPITRKTRVDATSLINELDDARAQAQATGNAAAMVAAVVAKAKICGLWVKKSEIKGKRDNVTLDRDETLRAIEAKHGTEVRQLLEQALDK
jgi:hypothetical protein